MSFKVSWKNLGSLYFVAAAALVFVAQIRYDTWLHFDTPTVNATYNVYIEPQPLSATDARYVSFGATEFMADWYWLRLIQYYGGGDPYGQYRKLAELFNSTTDLSPKFLAAYQTGLLILPGEGFVDPAIALGEKGQRNLPDSWEIPYNEGLVYHIYKKDYAMAAKEFTIAASKPGAPPNTKYFAAIYYQHADQLETALALFQTVYQNSTDSFVKDRAKKYIDDIEGLLYLRDAVAAFNQKFRRNPQSLNELVDKKIAPALPTSPLNNTYTYDAKTGTVGEAPNK